jgi:hypothetical protein
MLPVMLVLDCTSHEGSLHFLHPLKRRRGMPAGAPLSLRPVQLAKQLRLPGGADPGPGRQRAFSTGLGR